MRRVTFRSYSKHIKREGFGSFHSGDIEVLVRQSPDEYAIPEIYESICAKTSPELLSFGTLLVYILLHVEGLLLY